MSTNMNPEAGTSKMIENSSQGHSKKKFKLYHEGSAPVSFTDIDSLPDEMMIEIFSHLDAVDKFRVQKVCSRWSNLARNEVLWRCINMQNISPSFFVGLLTSLPSCVSQLRMRFNETETAIALTFLEVMAKLQNQCPHLNTVIFENIQFIQRIDSVDKFPEIDYLTLGELTKSVKKIDYLTLGELTKSAKKILESEFCKENDINFMHVVLSELKILSLREVCFSRFLFFSHIPVATLPNLVVLDLSYSESIDSTTLSSEPFCTLVNLEELYLSGWYIPDSSALNCLKDMKKLRVLDLEECLINDETFSFLKENCVALEELYFANNIIRHIYRSEKDKDFFSKLQTLCLINTNVGPDGIENLLDECPSLKYVDVTCCKFIDKSRYDGLSKDMKGVLFLAYEHEYFYSPRCCHFLSKYCDF